MKAKDGLRVVVAEDEPIILRYIAKKVGEADPAIHVVGAAADGQQALEMAREQRPHLLITDIEMPGMDGLELTRQVKELYPEIYVIIISGYSHFHYAQSALRYGVSDYLLKPVEEAVLATTLRDILARVGEKQRLSQVQATIREQREQAPLPEQAAHQPDIARELENHIQAYYNKPLSIADLAAQFNYTASYINRIFKKQYTVSPIRYQIQLRMERAKEMMWQFPQADIKDIAGAVGYDDARYFSRVFRQIEGTTPSEYLQALAQRTGGIG